MLYSDCDSSVLSPSSSSSVLALRRWHSPVVRVVFSIICSNTRTPRYRYFRIIDDWDVSPDVKNQPRGMYRAYEYFVDLFPLFLPSVCHSRNNEQLQQWIRASHILNCLYSSCWTAATLSVHLRLRSTYCRYRVWSSWEDGGKERKKEGFSVDFNVIWDGWNSVYLRALLASSFPPLIPHRNILKEQRSGRS